MLISDGDADTLRWPTLLAAGGDADLTVVLLDDAAALARSTHPGGPALDVLSDNGVQVLVDVGALRRRGLRTSDVRQGVKPTDLGAVGDLLVDATDKVVWL